MSSSGFITAYLLIDHGTSVRQAWLHGEAITAQPGGIVVVVSWQML
jgi:hypothetical protein